MILDPHIGGRDISIKRCASNALLSLNLIFDDIMEIKHFLKSKKAG